MCGISDFFENNERCTKFGSSLYIISIINLLLLIINVLLYHFSTLNISATD